MQDSTRETAPAVTDVLPQAAAIVRKHAGSPGAAIPILQDLQSAFGFIPVNLLPFVASLSGLALSELYSIVTFYAQFRTKPIGKFLVQSCHGTACHLAGAEDVTSLIEQTLGIAEGEDTSSDGLYTVERVACLGCCSLAPVVNIDGQTFGRLTPDEAASLVKRHQTSHREEDDLQNGTDQPEAK